MDDTFLGSFYDHISIAEKDLDLIVNAHKEITVSKNQTIVSEGIVSTSSYIVKKGSFRSYTIDSNGNDVTINFYQRGEVLADAGSLLQKKPSTESIVALENGVLLELTVSSFLQLHNNIEAYRVWRREWVAQEFLKLKDRSIKFRTLDAKERYLTLLKDKPEAIRYARLKHIASYLGITDTSLSRIRRELFQRK